MYDGGRHTRKNIGVWFLALLIGIGVTLSVGAASTGASEKRAIMDSTKMQGHEMTMGDDRGHKEEKIEGEKSKKERKILYWVAPMDPNYRSSKPGKSPMGMDLVPVYEDEDEEAYEEEGEGVLSRVKLKSREVQLADVKTDRVAYRSLTKHIRTIGKIEYDETRLAHVAAWVAGRVDRLFVNFTGADVGKGEPLLEIYSPNLVTTQEEYLLALETLDKVQNSRIPETIEGARSLVRASKKRLLLWGISEQQIEELERDREARTHMTVYAPIGGTVIKKMVKEGMYVKEGHVFFDIADLSRVWVIADIYESELAWIQTGQMVEIGVEAYPGERFMGSITFVDPFLNPKTRAVGVRIEVPNGEMKLKPEMFADVDVYVPQGNVLAVPKTAVLNTGMRKIVYLNRGKGRFVGMEVSIGPEANGYYPVLAGLSEGEEVVTAANFLIDSQSQLRTGASALYGGAKEIKEGEAPPPAMEHPK